MTLIVEDGTGVMGAESYNSLVELDAHMVKMGYADWPIPVEGEEDPNVAKKEASARRAAMYLDSKYQARLSGKSKSLDQGLAWPRIGAKDYYGRELSPDEVPRAARIAHAEISLLAYTNTQLSAKTEAGPLLKRKKIDVLEWEWDIDSYGQSPVFGWVDQLLSGLFGPASAPGSLQILGVERA